MLSAATTTPSVQKKATTTVIRGKRCSPSFQDTYYRSTPLAAQTTTLSPTSIHFQHNDGRSGSSDSRSERRLDTLAEIERRPGTAPYSGHERGLNARVRRGRH